MTTIHLSTNIENFTPTAFEIFNVINFNSQVGGLFTTHEDVNSDEFTLNTIVLNFGGTYPPIELKVHNLRLDEIVVSSVSRYRTMDVTLSKQCGDYQFTMVSVLSLYSPKNRGIGAFDRFIFSLNKKEFKALLFVGLMVI